MGYDHNTQYSVIIHRTIEDIYTMATKTYYDLWPIWLSFFKEYTITLPIIYHATYLRSYLYISYVAWLDD